MTRVNQCKGQRGHPPEQLHFSQSIVQECCLVLSRGAPPKFHTDLMFIARELNFVFFSPFFPYTTTFMGLQMTVSNHGASFSLTRCACRAARFDAGESKCRDKSQSTARGFRFGERLGVEPG